MPMDDTAALTIRTPEGVSFSYRLASPFSRMLAWWIDAACIIVVYMLANRLLLFVAVFLGRHLVFAVNILIMAFCNLAYFIAFEWKARGQTPGKRVLRLRVMDAEGLRLEFGQVVVRNVLRLIDGLPFLYAVGGVAAVLSPRRRRLGDLAAGTVVVRVPRRVAPDLEPVDPGKYNSLRRHPLLAARLRQNVTPEQAMTALEALARRERLDPDARIALFREMADYFRSIVRFPEDVLVGLSDEQLVRNVVEIVLTS